MIITLKHARARGHCTRGMRDFFKREGLDWNKFISEGLPEEVLLATDNANVKKVVEYAHGREE